MDFWVGFVYLVTPLLLGFLGGLEMMQLVIFFYPLISIVFFIVRHRYLKTLNAEQQRQVVPYSYIYTGYAISMVILVLAIVSCVVAFFNY
ncbi:hypothetical protein ACXX81_21725 [Pseudomonas sp. GNP013]